MLIYYMLPFLWCIIYVLNRGKSIKNYYAFDYIIKQSVARKKVIVISGILLLVVMGFRSQSVGTDTESYARTYMNFANYRLSDLKFSIQDEIGYDLLQWFFAKLGVPWQLFLFSISLFVVCSIGKFLYNYSANPFWGYYLYLTIGMFSMNMTGVRQSIAVAIVLFAYEYARCRKIVPFVVLCILAASFHYTAIIFALVYIIFMIPFRVKEQLLIGLAIPIVVRIFGEAFLEIISRFALKKYIFSGYFDSMNYDMNPLVEIVAILILCACFICLYFVQKEINEREFHMFLLTGMYVACIELGHVIYIATRLNFYFVFFMTCLLGNVVYSFKDKKFRVIVMMMLLVLPFMQMVITVPGSSYGIDTYSFFWDR